ncbi:MAG: hypothetical protein EBX36_07715, partial [Planctomycetia bacterium]|nr:hypothetical protein [Planctomycetia bacterium]
MRPVAHAPVPDPSAPGIQMHLIRVGGTALNQTPLDWDGNRDRIVAAIAAARERGVAILCLPELCISG